MTTTAPIALITGGSRGLGKNAALALAQQGTDIILTYQQNAAAAQAVISEIEWLGRKAVALPLDVADSSSFAAFADTVRQQLQQYWQRDSFNYLLNNAGIGINAPFTDTTEQQFDQLMRIHVKGPYFLTQQLLPLINDGGRIINISSGLARFSLPGYAAYASMKGAMEVLTRYQAKELGGRGISVNILAPGAIETDFGGGAAALVALLELPLVADELGAVIAVAFTVLSVDTSVSLPCKRPARTRSATVTP